MGRESPKTPKAVLTPTIRDIAWAAGLFEGEGCAIYASQTTRLSVSQNDPWILETLALLFGGRIQKRRSRNKLSDNAQWAWTVSGARARGVGMTIYPLLSPRRQAQMRKALHLPTRSIS
jgi:hypothetical protein